MHLDLSSRTLFGKHFDNGGGTGGRLPAADPGICVRGALPRPLLFLLPSPKAGVRGFLPREKF